MSGRASHKAAGRRWRHDYGWFLGSEKPRGRGGCIYEGGGSYFVGVWPQRDPSAVREFKSLAAAKRAVERWLAAHGKRGRAR